MPTSRWWPPHPAYNPPGLLGLRLPNQRSIRPSKRRARISGRPSSAGASHPLRDYIVPPTDAKGRSNTFSIAVAPSVPRLATTLIMKNRLPFKTPQDMYRWCIAHGMEALVRLIDDEDVKTDWSHIASHNRIAAKMQEDREYGQHLRAMLSEIKKQVEAGHKDGAVQLATLVWKDADTVEDPHWRVVYRQVAKRALDQVKKGRDVEIPKDGRFHKEDEDEE